MNRYPLWKYLLLASIIALAFVYAAPNLYAPDPAVQITGQSSGLVLDEATTEQVTSALDEAGIKHFGETSDGSAILIRLYSAEDQQAAKKIIGRTLGSDFVVALNMAPTTPEWLRSLGAGPMKLGLDLSGGVHFLMEVDTSSALEKQQKATVNELRGKLREANARARSVRVDDDNVLNIVFDSVEARDEASSIIRREMTNLTQQIDRLENGNFRIRASIKEDYIRELEDIAVQQNLTTLRNRVNELGVSEPLVQRQGRNRIVVELPGVQDTAAAKRIIGKTANLEFRLEAKPNELAFRKEYFEYRSEEDARRFGGAYLEKRIVITGDLVSTARAGFDPETNKPEVNITLSGRGAEKMYRSSSKAVGRNQGVLFIEYKTETTYKTDEDGEQIPVYTQTVEKQIISLATIQSALGKQFRITGLDSAAEASELSLLLRAGALAAPMYFVEERTIGPSLGAENIKLGVTSVYIGLSLVVIFMLGFYKLFGVAANIALTTNLLLLIAAMSMLGATLTLPGIAGIVLTVGMAVDANVLIFSRIKEEVANGQPPQSAINRGFDSAFSTILDANITTLIVAVILFAIGTGPVKGFAVTLSIGILTSMFTAIVGTRAVVNLMYGGRSVKKLWI